MPRNIKLRTSLSIKKVQSILEYAVLIGIIAAAIGAIATYVQRATQANLKLIEDQNSPRPVAPGSD